MKKIASALLALLMLVSLLSACAASAPSVYGTYARRNSDGSVFTITLHEDGSYQYYESMLSSHIGVGNFTFEDNTVTIVDDQIPGVSGSLTITVVFGFENGNLIYRAEESDRFMYVNLPDGAEFVPLDRLGQ